MTVGCPIDGCDYAGDTAESVRGHVMGKRDEPHRGYTWSEIGELLGIDGDADRSGGTETVEFPEADRDPDPDPDPECPDCGETDHMTTAEAKERLPGEPQPILDEFEFVCLSCGEVFGE